MAYIIEDSVGIDSVYVFSMKNIIVEVRDERDKDLSEPWSFFGAYESLEQFQKREWNIFVKYCNDHPIVEVRIRKV